MAATREERFERLAAEVTGPLRAYVVRRCAPDDVDDVLAEVATVLWRRIDDVPQGAPLPWSYGVARRVLANHRRAAQRRSRLWERIRAVDPPVEHAPAPEHPEVHAALARLPELDREVVRLWAWEDLAPREIATVTGLSANAVSVRLTRARQRLARDLGAADERNRAVPDTNQVKTEE